jgi:RimJ/RimL family protein N-acetyltransferase
MTLLERRPAESARPGGQPVLETARLVLRPSGMADAPSIAAIINDRRIAENTARVPHPYTVADAEAFIAHVQTGREIALLITLPDDTIVGGCGCGRLRADGLEIGYWLGVPYWGRGYATEAARALIDHVCGDLGHEELLGGARVSNPASRRGLEKCGFQWTGAVLQRVRALGTSVPCDRFRFTRARWAALHARKPACRIAVA